MTTTHAAVDAPAKDANAKKIRVGFVMHVMQVAGAEVLVTQIIEQLSDRIEATVFCLDALGELGQKLLDAGIPVIVLNRKPGLDRDVAKRLANEVKSRQIEVLHAHQYTPFFYSALSRMLHRTKTKILFTEHGRHYPDIVSTKRRLANRLVLQHYADISTACCDFSAKALREIEGFPKAITLPNGVDLRGLPERGPQEKTNQMREKLGMQTGIPYAACIARFHPVKDHETLIRAWQVVNQSLPTAKLLLVGDGECRDKCEALCRELDLKDSVEFWGIRHDVPEILRAIDVFALTSVSEAASLTLLEAMASGCPAVLTDVGGNAEHVTHGIEGFLAPRSDSQTIGERLLELLSSPNHSEVMGAAARKRVESDFDLTGVIEQYAAHFQKLAKC
ncbi:glycosyltransferase [Rhodopirellula sp.]|nr:glycosyltransferase [Rhodopirellula sp.]